MESNKNNIAFLIPIHEKDYNYMDNLMKNINIINNAADIYFILSTQNDYDKLDLKYKKNFKYIIIEHKPNIGNIVIYKKMYALNYMKEREEYDYFIICDSEIDIIPENFTRDNIQNKINSFFKKKMIYSGKIKNKHNRRIIETTCNSFKDKNDCNKLKNGVLNNNNYYWWSDVPYVKRTHISDFFNKLKDIKKYTWHHFEHILYLNYLYLYHDFIFINISHILEKYPSLESFYSADSNKFEELKNAEYIFSWITPRLYYNNMNILKDDKPFMFYHLDREFYKYVCNKHKENVPRHRYFNRNSPRANTKETYKLSCGCVYGFYTIYR